MDVQVTPTTRKVLEVVVARTIVVGICVVLRCLRWTVLEELVVNGSGTIRRARGLHKSNLVRFPYSNNNRLNIKIMVARITLWTFQLPFFKDPYKQWRGCKDSDTLGSCMPKKELDGERCVSEDQCTNCTFGKCVQLSKYKDSAGFSYTKKPDGNSFCKLCTIGHLETLKKELYGTVYKKFGNFRETVTVFFISYNIGWYKMLR